jgi:endo-1,4-beta-xylanase
MNNFKPDMGQKLNRHLKFYAASSAIALLACGACLQQTPQQVHAQNDAPASENPARAKQMFAPGSLYAKLREEFKAVGPVVFVAGTRSANGQIEADDAHILEAFGAGNNPVEGQPFQTARKVSVTQKPANLWDINLSVRNSIPVKKGDTLLVTYYARGTKRPAAVDDGRGAIVQPFLKGPGNVRTEFSNLNEITPQWERYWFTSRTPVDRDFAPGEIELLMMLGVKAQDVEIGGIAVMAFPQGSDLTKLPRKTWNYAGREANAPWRKTADARIEKYRKNSLRVLVSDKNGRPVSGAQIKVNMTRHAFPFSSALVTSHWRGDSLSKEDTAQYREKFRLAFNGLVPENDLKWAASIGEWSENFNLEKTVQTLRELKAEGYYVRGHVLVWPGFEHTPNKYKALHDKPEELRRVVRERVVDLVSRTRGIVDDWDVTNETEGNRQYMDILGRDEMLEWYRLARRTDPKVKLTFNEPSFGVGGMEAGSWTNKTGDSYRGWVDFLVKKGAPLDHLGAQTHGGFTGVGKNGGPESAWKFYDEQFARYGKKLIITELDVNIEDDRDPEQLAYQADKLRDTIIIAFAHPAFDGILQWGFWEGAHWFPKAALWRKNWEIKPNGQAYLDLVNKKWRTRASGKSNAKGEYSLRGFKGDYEIEVTANGKTQKVKTKIGDKPGIVTIKLP